VSSSFSFCFPDPKGVHIWTTALDIVAGSRPRPAKVLSKSELARAERFHFEKERNRYVIAHAWLRKLLGSYLCVSAASVEFAEGPKGKPSLAGRAASSGLEFNLAHSQEQLALAIAYQTAVGVDIEHIRPLPDADEIVRRFFSKREQLRFESLSDELKSMAFFNLWTRKEAWLKATGEGIAHLLGQVEVSFVPGEPARLENLPAGFPAASNWSLHDWVPEPGFAAAVAVASPGCQFLLQRWSWESAGFDG
jgi:4'-phosphopantetheinyl transferase